MCGPLPKILVVDDDRLMLQALQRMLASEAELVLVTSARDAIKHARDDEFALVLTDLVMPDMSGYELVEALGFLCPTTVCVVLTGRIEDPYSRDLPFNVLTCLHKPCTVDKLVQTLHSALAEYVLRSAKIKAKSPGLTNPCF